VLDVKQSLALAAKERIRIAHALRRRVYPANAKTSANAITPPSRYRLPSRIS